MNQANLKTAFEHIENGIGHKKCHKCGCQQGTIKAIEKNIQHFKNEDQLELNSLIQKSKETFVPVEYDCLGCNICFPAIVTSEIMNAYPSIQIEDDGCAIEDRIVKENNEWPPLSGNYEILNKEASVAICTLNSRSLAKEIINSQSKFVNIVGSLSTENLGIERIIKNVTSNPQIRFLILCGEDTQQTIGHLPGQSLVCLFANGIDSSNKIIGAKGKRPVLKNIDSESIELFRNQVTLIDMIGNVHSDELLEIASGKSKIKSSTINNFNLNQIQVQKIHARSPNALVLDPKGYFVIFPDKQKELIIVEHYLNNGKLNQIIEGTDIGSIYSTIISLDLIGRFDHACYLGKELARAEESLKSGATYIQDKAQDIIETDNNEIKSNCSNKGCC